MPVTLDARTLAAALLVLTPLIGGIPIGYPPLLPVWSATRERHIEIIAAHRRSWLLLNAGFCLATLGTGAGLVALAVDLADDASVSVAVGALAAVYLAAGVLWCAVLAIRARTTPALFDLGATHAEPGPAEVLLGAATGGMFVAFVLATAGTLVCLCAVLALGGVVPVVVAIVGGLIAAVALVGQLVTGDTIPAILYLPTLLVGISLLAGWS
jgi:hypothetical protein